VPVPSRRVTPETFIAAFVAASAAVMAAGYLIDAVGVAMHPALLAVAAAAGGVAALLAFRDSSPLPRGSSVLFGLVVTGTFAYLLWLGWPSLLPVTNGPDVVHHLLLIHVIQRTHHLVHGPELGPYLLEMVNYTPGAHIMAATVAGWLRLDALRVLLPVTAAFVAVKAGVIYMLALRIVPARAGASLHAAAAPVLLAVPGVYVLGSFFQFYFYSQVVSETFAMAMVLAAVNWARTGERRQLRLAAVCGVGVFLSWPVWLGPALAAVLLAILGGAPAWRARFTAAAIVVVPIAVFGILHASTHAAGAAIIGSSGAVTRPSAENIGAAFAVLGLVGAMLAVRAAPARPVVALLLVTVLQALALAALDRRAGSASFYMPLKMVYLAVLPCAVLGALALATAIAAVSSRLPRVERAMVLVPLAVAVLLARGRIPMTRQHGPISEPSLAAGLWARGAVPPGCVDYFSRHWLTGYWLHLDVLGNPRLSDRMRAETFDFPDVVGKWIEGRGLPYAIVEDFAAVPRDARVDMVVLREFPPAAVVQNRRPAPAPGSDPKVALCRGK
jgi:hypothetical protein